jgi:hypothetical protein
MTPHIHSSNLTALARRTCRLAHSNILQATLAGLLFVQAHPASAALSFVIGTPTTVGSIQFSSAPDSVTITGAFTGPGVINTALGIPANRIQYDIINSDQGSMNSWTIYYSPTVGPSIIGAFTPLGYVTSSGTAVPGGGGAYTTLFNAGYGPYTYNTGAPWTIDYEVDHITFTATAPFPAGLPANDGVGELMPTPYLPAFAVLYNPALAYGLVPASATISTANLNGQVYGPLPGNACLSIQCTNLVVQTCSNCLPVSFSATAVDTCCSNVTLQYFPPPDTCFSNNSTNLVEVVATDSCGNSASNHFTVTVLPGPNCGGATNCISIYCSNIVAFTCSNCTTVPFNATAVDNCCPGSGVTLVYNAPATECFPIDSTNLVEVTAYDDCGNSATSSFYVTVLPGPNCGGTSNCISINCSNIVAFTCSNCTKVPFTAMAVDNCCPASGVTLVYNPPATTCFPIDSTNKVEVIAYDNCGNTASNFFYVTVLQGPNCGGTTNCISINCSNIVVFTCSNCTTVPFTATAVDTCCASGATLLYAPPVTTCFPVDSTNQVVVIAYDNCGNTASNSFYVTVLPGPNCGGTTPEISLAGGTNRIGSGTNFMTVSWPASNAQLQQSQDLIHWTSIPGATNSPYVVSNPPPRSFFRLQYH